MIPGSGPYNGRKRHPRALEGFTVKRVLIVEDNLEVNALLCRYLEQRNFRCDGANSAAQALSQLDADGAPDLILMDLELPDLDGADLYARIRARRDGVSVPVLVMTGYQRKEELERMREDGVEAYLFKPFSPRELLEKVQAIVAS